MLYTCILSDRNLLYTGVKCAINLLAPADFSTQNESTDTVLERAIHTQFLPNYENFSEIQYLKKLQDFKNSTSAQLISPDAQ